MDKNGPCAVEHVNIISFKSSGTDTSSFGPKDAESN